MKMTILIFFYLLSFSALSYDKCSKPNLSIIDNCHKIENEGLFYNRYQMSYDCSDNIKRTVVFASETLTDFFAPIKEATISYDVCDEFSDTITSFEFRTSEKPIEELLIEKRKSLTRRSNPKRRSFEQFAEDELIWWVLF